MLSQVLPIILKYGPMVWGLITSVGNLTKSGATNDFIANALKGMIPAEALPIVQEWAASLFNSVKPGLQIVAAVQTAFDADRNKTIQNLLNTANDFMKLGLSPLIVDGYYGPKTQDMAKAVQRKLGGDVVADGWIGTISLGALQMFMQAK